MTGTKEQHAKISDLQKIGYKWDKQLSGAMMAVVLVKGADKWVFGLDGSIAHNPQCLIFKIN